MHSGVSIIERAFQIARSGTVSSVIDLKRALNSEGYAGHSLEGRTLFRQLQALIRTARKTVGPNEEAAPR